MAVQKGRYPVSGNPRVAEGWSLEQLTPPSRLFGANGLRTGPDGRIYVAQVSGSQISAVDVDTGAVEVISPKGGDIVAPDDLVFDEDGNFYATEITEGRVSMRDRSGRTRVIQGDMPCANPITWHQGKLYAGECRVGGRIMQLDLGGGAPRILAENVPLPNAMQVGPDGKLYFPVMGTNEIWRISLDGGEPEVVATGLGVPDAVKFDSRGRIVSVQVASGQVLRIDPQTGEQTVLANVAPGLDNLDFIGERLFVSSISGQINEVLENGKLRSVVPDGFNGPFDLAMGDDGVLFIADGPFSYHLRPGNKPEVAGMLFSPATPGYVRGVVADATGEVVVTTANGTVVRYRPAAQQSEVLASGFDQLFGIDRISASAVVVAELGAGKVHSISDSGQVETLATDLDKPLGVAITDNGGCYITESGAGRLVNVRSGAVDVVLDDLRDPQGIVAQGDMLYIVDAGSKELIEYDMQSHTRRTIVTDLPVGAPPGVVPKFLDAIGDMSGPMGPFAGITVGADGSLYLSADGAGSILSVSRL